MTILITGANGYIGSHLTRRLVDAGERPRCQIRRGARVSSLPVNDIDLVYGDVTDPASLAPLLQDVRAVIHLAAVTANVKESSRVSYQRVNADGARNVMRAAQVAGVERVILLSGIGTQPDGDGSWIRTRWEGEEAVRHGGLPYTILQPSVLFGGKRAEFIQAQVRVLRIAPVAPILGDGRLKFQPIWIEDVCTCIIKTLRDPALIDRTVAIGGPEIFTYEQIIDLLMETMGRRKLKVKIPLSIMRMNAALAQAILAKPPLTTATLELFALGDNVTTIDALPSIFAIQPRSLRDELRDHGI